jgi:DNA-binding transcriptional LysR family regulator
MLKAAFELVALRNLATIPQLVEELRVVGYPMSMDTFIRKLNCLEHLSRSDLIDRGKDVVKLQLTHTGKVLIPELTDVVMRYTRFVDQVVPTIASSETVTIVTESMFATHLFPRLVDQFCKLRHKDDPRLSFELREASSMQQALDKLRDPSVSMCLYSDRPTGKRIASPERINASRPLLWLQDVALIPKYPQFRHLLERKRPLRLAELADQPLCYVEEGIPGSEFVKAVEAPQHVICQSLTAVREMARSREMIGLCHDWHAFLGEDWSKWWDILRLQWKREKLAVRLYTRDESSMTKAAKKFRDFVKEAVPNEQVLTFVNNRAIAGNRAQSK